MDDSFLFSFSIRKVIIHFIRHAIFATDRKIDKIVKIFGNRYTGSFINQILELRGEFKVENRFR